MTSLIVSPASSFGVNANQLTFWGDLLPYVSPKVRQATVGSSPDLGLEVVTFSSKKHSGSIIVRPLDDGGQLMARIVWKHKVYETRFSFVSKEESLANFIKYHRLFHVPNHPMGGKF